MSAAKRLASRGPSSLVNINNVRLEQFPHLLLASSVGLVRRPLFEATDADRADVDVGAKLIA